MSKYMKEPGNMKVDVENIQAPESANSGKFYGSTTDYISRQDKRLKSEVSELRKQKYEGRYD